MRGQPRHFRAGSTIRLALDSTWGWDAGAQLQQGLGSQSFYVVNFWNTPLTREQQLTRAEADGCLLVTRNHTYYIVLQGGYRVLRL